MVIVSPRVIAEHTLCFEFPATNNKAEYETFIIGLQIVKELGMQDLKAYNNLKLVIRHIRDDYKARGEKYDKVPTKGQTLGFYTS